MNKQIRLNHLLLTLVLLILASTGNCQELIKFLKTQQEVVNIDSIEGNSFFKQTYVLKIRQPLDHKDTTNGFFLQRVFLADRDPARPVVLITEGYAAGYASNPKYINELTTMLDANQICVEHRYFGESIPDSLDWQFLTVENAAKDHHRIVELFKKYYHENWLNTGISKGGQTALAHRAFFPSDISATVAYVAPLNFGVEDGRHELFLKQVGTSECRFQIEKFQREILKRRDQMRPLLKQYATARAYQFPITLDEVLDYVVLEFPFAFWQWGYDCTKIPDSSSDDQLLFEYLTKSSPPDYFSYEGSAKYRAFFYQAAHELGYYGYDTKPLDNLLSVKSAKGYLNQFMLPSATPVQYSDNTSRKVEAFLKDDAENVILIYGEIDPWSASSAEVRERGNNYKFVLKNGSHKTRIASFEEKTRQKIEKQIYKMVRATP